MECSAKSICGAWRRGAWMAMVAVMLLPWGADAGEATTQGVKAVDAVVAATVAICLCVWAGGRRGEGWRMEITGIDLAVAAMGALQAFWVWRGWECADREAVWRTAAYGMAYAAGRACGWKGEAWGWWTLVAAWAAQAAFGLEEATDGWRRWRGWQETTGSLGNSGIWSGVTACAGVAAWACLRGSWRRWAKAAAWLAVGATAAMLAAGDSRAAWLAYAAGSVWGWRGAWQGRTRRMATIGAAVAAIGIVAAIGARPERAASAEGRTLVWKVAGRVFADHPWGTGADGFRRTYGAAQGEYLRTEGTERERTLADETTVAFNEGVRTAVETGVPGLALLGLLAWLAARRGRREDEEAEGRERSVESLLAAWATFALFSYPAAVFQCGALFWLALAAKASGAKAVATLRGGVWLAAGATAAVAAVVALQFPQRRALAAWEDCLRRETVEAGAFKGRLRPLRNGYHTLTNAAILLNREERHGEAEAAARRAAEVYSSYAAFVEWGIAAEGAGAHARADSAWRRAGELLPRRLKPPYYRMELYARQGEEAMAQEMARQILATPAKVRTAEAAYIRERAAEVAAAQK